MSGPNGIDPNKSNNFQIKKTKAQPGSLKMLKIVDNAIIGNALQLSQTSFTDNTDKVEIKSVVFLDKNRQPGNASKPQVNDLFGTMNLYWQSVLRFVGLKQKAKEVVATLKDPNAVSGEKGKAIDEFIDVLNLPFKSKGIDDLKKLSYNEKIDLLGKLIKGISESKDSSQLLVRRSNAGIVITLLADSKEKDALTVELITVTEDKVTEIRTKDSTKIKDKGLDEAQANDIVKDTANLHEVVEMDKNTIFEKPSIMPKDVWEKTEQNIQAIKQNAIELIKVAADKGFKLDNIDQLASIARETTDPENVAASVPLTAENLTQWNILNKIQNASDALFEAIYSMLQAKRQESEAAAEKKAQNNAEEEKYIKAAMLRKDELKKLINIIHGKKLQDKLNAAVIVLSYLLKNPDQISEVLLGSLKDEIKKLTTPPPFEH